MKQVRTATCRDRLARFEIDEREAEVVGAAPRFEAIPDAEISAQVRATVNETRASIGLGPANPLPEYTRLIAKSQPTFRAHMEMGTGIFSGEICAAERELAVLRVAWVSGAPYEWGEHVKIAKRFGITPESIERITEGPSASEWSVHEAAILRGVDELILNQTLSDQTYATLQREWSEAQMIEYLVTVGHYVATAFIQNSLRVRLAADNPGLARR